MEELESTQKTPEVTKKRKNYTRKPKTTPPTPPNPAIVALESDILDMVRQRSAALAEVSAAGVALNQASARVQGARERLQQLETEVNYRMALIGQMKGTPQTSISGPTGTAWYPPTEVENGYGVSIPAGVGSVPAAIPFAPRVPGERRVRSESAESVRNDEVGVRAAI